MIPSPNVSVDYLTFRESKQFSARDVAYAEQDPKLAKFMSCPPTLAGFKTCIDQREKSHVDRNLLVKVIQDQYQEYALTPPENLASLTEANTFTLTTAHQASLFLGPLYYIYKILSTVALAKQLQEIYPNKNFIPTFVLGAEDHDLEEINHLQLKGEKIYWNTKQSGSTGAMHLKEIEPAIQKVLALLGDSEASKEISTLLQKCYKKEYTLGKATGKFVASLFKVYGLVVINLNDKRLKQNFIPYIKKEVLEQSSKAIIEQSVTHLVQAGYQQQAHVREINFFYLSPQRRDRIVRNGEEFEVLDTAIRFSEKQMQAEIEQHPERFSPNVVMRPILQEASLPNLAYIGGGGELAYWLERKAQFEYFGLPYPMLVRRDSAWWIDLSEAKKLEKLGLKNRDLLENEHKILKDFVKNKSDIDPEFGKEIEQISALCDDIAVRAQGIDASLSPRARALGAVFIKDLKKLEKRLIRTLKKRNESEVNAILDLREKIVPGGGLQERKSNFMEQYAVFGSHFFDTLLKHFDPLDMRLKIFTVKE